MSSAMPAVLLRPSLVLNSAYLPVSVVRAFEALCLVVTDKAALLAGDETEHIRSQFLSFPLPRVIRLLDFSGMPSNPAWSRLKVLYRDDQTCAWCGGRFKIDRLDCDHIIPRSRWRVCPRDLRRRYEAPADKLQNADAPWNSWQNTVASCRPCNAGRGNRFYWETGMKLLWEPYEPEYVPSVVVSFERAEKFGWLEYLFNNRGKPIFPSAVKVLALPPVSRAQQQR